MYLLKAWFAWQRIQDRIKQLYAENQDERSLSEKQKDHLANELVRSKMSLQSQEHEFKVTELTLKVHKIFGPCRVEIEIVGMPAKSSC